MDNRSKASKRPLEGNDQADSDERSPKRARVESAAKPSRVTLFYHNQNKQTAYVVMDDQINLLTEARIASLGTERETILLDMESKELNSYFQRLYQGLPEPLASTQPLDDLPEPESPTTPPTRIDEEQLMELNKFVSQSLDQKKFDAEYAAKYQNEDIANSLLKPIFPLEDFLKIGAGCCRHQVLFSVYLLAKLIHEKEIEPETCGLYICTAATAKKEEKEGRHTVVIFQMEGKRLFLDSSHGNGLVLDITSPIKEANDRRLSQLKSYYTSFDGVIFFNSIFEKSQPTLATLKKR